MYIVFIHFKADIFSGISSIIFALAGKNLPVCTIWSLRSKTFPLSVGKWEPFCCPAAMLEPCILPSKPWLYPWLHHQHSSTIPNFQFSAWGACWRRHYGLISDGALHRLDHFQDHSSTAWVPGWLAVLNPKKNLMKGREGASSNT